MGLTHNRQRWLITGDHTGYVPYEFVRYRLWDLSIARGCAREDPESGNYDFALEIHHGMAAGVDTWADRFAVNNWCGISGTRADWDRHGKAAGGIRNQRMLDEFKPDLVVAFPAPKSKGTWDMVRRAALANVETIIYRYVP